jgi:(2Fe-2S) ferredoxin
MQMPVIPQPTYYIFKCEQSSPPGIPRPSCVNDETKGLYNHIAHKLMHKGLLGPVQLIKTSCLGRCQQGPVMLIVGQNERFMYVNLTNDKVDRILDEHIINNVAVKEFLIEEQFWGEALDVSK